MAEAQQLCLKLLKETNKPYNVQGVADMLASQGVKKMAAEKALSTLCESGKITVKEFGKTKLYIPLQEGLRTLEPQDKEILLNEINDLQGKVKLQEGLVVDLRRKLGSANSELTMEELQAKAKKLQTEKDELETKLESLRQGASLISSEDVATAEEIFSVAITAWTKYRRIFRSIWDTISENIDAKQSDLFEEIGIDTDETVGERLEDYQRLLAKKAKR